MSTRYLAETENFSAENFRTEYSVGRESRVSVLQTLLGCFAFVSILFFIIAAIKWNIISTTAEMDPEILKLTSMVDIAIWLLFIRIYLAHLASNFRDTSILFSVCGLFSPSFMVHSWICLERQIKSKNCYHKCTMKTNALLSNDKSLN